MSDTFNHFHYLDKRLLNESPKDVAPFSWASHLQQRKAQFNDFSFLVTDSQGVVYSDIPIIDINASEIKLESSDNKKVFWIRVNSANNINSLRISKKVILVQEDIGLTKNTQEMTINSDGDNEYYYITHHLNSQLSLNKVRINIAGRLKSYFLTLGNNQKHKNEIVYELAQSSKLMHHSLSKIAKGQMQDDSIEVIHSAHSHSEIFYEGLNKGRLSTQVNSVIGMESENCSTHQHIKHVALEKSAITNSKPNLMIANNNVVASHGNSIGTFNANDLFYLAQRGLNQQQSYSTLEESVCLKFIDSTSIAEALTSYYRGVTK